MSPGERGTLLVLVAGMLAVIYFMGGWVLGILFEPLGQIIFWQFLIFGFVVVIVLILIVVAVISLIAALGG